MPNTKPDPKTKQNNTKNKNKKKTKQKKKHFCFLMSHLKVNSLGSLLLVGQIDSSTVPEEYGMQDIYLDYRKKQASAVKKGKARSEFRSWSVQGHKGTLLTRGGAGS